MIGTWRWNLAVASAAGLLTLVLSWPKNPVATSVTRALLAFAILFAAVYAVRWLWGFAFRPGRAEDGASAGLAVDLATPADDETLLREMMNLPPGESGGDDFVPLQPEKLVSRDKLPPDVLARAVSQMSKD